MSKLIEKKGLRNNGFNVGSTGHSVIMLVISLVIISGALWLVMKWKNKIIVVKE